MSGDGSAAAMWLGPVHTEARAGYERARNAGLSPMRALVVGSIASFQECWAFRKNLARHVGCSVRTVQRAITQAKAEGLIGTARAKKTEVPPHWPHGPVTCGWSHRWVIGWGKAGEAVKDAVAAAKARWMVKVATPQKMTTRPPGSTMDPAAPRPRTVHQRRSWTADELDAELERLDALKKPPPF